MTARKPPGVGWDSWVETQILEAQQRGEFDNLRGAGQPIPGIDDPPDDLWWVKQLLKREQLSFTPPALALRKAREDLLDRLGDFRSEDAVRKAVGELNERIRHINRVATTGPPSTLMPLDVERVILLWTERRDQRP
jgi:hypothetical protein